MWLRGCCLSTGPLLLAGSPASSRRRRHTSTERAARGRRLCTRLRCPPLSRARWRPRPPSTWPRLSPSPTLLGIPRSGNPNELEPHALCGGLIDPTAPHRRWTVVASLSVPGDPPGPSGLVESSRRPLVDECGLRRAGRWRSPQIWRNPQQSLSTQTDTQGCAGWPSVRRGYGGGHEIWRAPASKRTRCS